MSAASLRIARRIAIRARASANAPTQAAPRAARPAPEPVEIELDLSDSVVVRGTTVNGVRYAKFESLSGPTVLAFGEIAETAGESMRASGLGLVRGKSVKIVAIRPFEHRDTLIDELGDEYVAPLAA
jgi:hypothetical protein